MRKEDLSMETKQLILADYQNRDIKVHDIHKKYGVTLKTVQEVVLEMGGQLRVPKRQGKRGNKTKVCNKCHKTIELKGARFCPYCANDLRSDSEMLAEKVEKLKELYAFLPETQRDNFIQVLCKVNELLLKGDNNEQTTKRL